MIVIRIHKNARTPISTLWESTLTILVLPFVTMVALAQQSPHLEMPWKCNLCHTTKSWHQIKFAHDTTGFLLKGQHRRLACLDCHQIEDFSQVNAQCKSCHIDVHQDKLGTRCQNCHSFENWEVKDIQRAHQNTTFPLIGAHARLDCQTCHNREIEGEYSLLQSECISCHRQDFQATKNPVHTAMGFGSRCEDCHSMLSWRPATFRKHDELYFPIFRGSHAGAWSQCADCHPSPNNYQVFTCVDCHEHRRDKMDREHHEVGGYSYDSQACYSCHPQGSKEGGD